MSESLGPATFGMEEVESCVVDGWRRNFDQKEFISYRIILKFKDSEQTQIIERRYSEFLLFHMEVKDAFDDATRRRLIESFPAKQPLSLQTDNFAEKRSRALDAFLQILLYALRTTNSTAKTTGKVKKFFNLAAESKATYAKTENPNNRGTILKTPNLINLEIEKLRHQLNMSADMNKSEFKELQNQVQELQEKRGRSEEDLRCIEKFYELKREWEVKKIRSGTFDGNEFSISGPNKNKSETAEALKEPHDATTVVNDELLVQGTKRNLHDQEAILYDLAETLSKQKLLSKEICSEIVEQNRLLGRVSEKQGIVAEEFKGSNDRLDN